MKKILIPMAFLASVLGGYTQDTNAYANHNQTKNSIHQLVNKVIATPPKLYNLEEQLQQQYGNNSAKYALQIIDNGRRIRESPDKEKYLSGIERTLREKFPLIKPPRLFGFIDEPREAENVAMLHRSMEEVLSRAKKDGVDFPMSLVISALSNEGHSLDVDRPHYENGGFYSYGLDTFGSEFKYIVKRGYLPESFKSQFEISIHTNEKGKKVKSANFKTKQDAFRAFIATLAHRQYLFFEDLRKYKIPVTEIPKEQVLFFTYKYYNGGPDSAEKLLKKGSAKEIDKYFKRVITRGSTGNAYVVLSGSQWLELSGATDPNPKGKYWWSK